MVAETLPLPNGDLSFNPNPTPAKKSRDSERRRRRRKQKKNSKASQAADLSSVDDSDGPNDDSKENNHPQLVFLSLYPSSVSSV